MEIEMHALNQKSSTITVHVPKRSFNYLIRRNVTIAAGAMIGCGIVVGAVMYLARSAFTDHPISDGIDSAFTEHPTLEDRMQYFPNLSSLSLYKIYKYLTGEESVFSQCKPDFTHHLAVFPNCGISLCDCIRNAREVFENHCSIYAQNVVQNPSECQEVANTMQRCKEYTC